MIFNREDLLDILDSDQFVESTILKPNRWSITLRSIFEHEGKLYQAIYRSGFGDEGETPFEGEDEIECPEVIEIEVTTKKYVLKE